MIQNKKYCLLCKKKADEGKTLLKDQYKKIISHLSICQLSMKSNPKLKDTFIEHLPKDILLSDLLASVKAKSTRVDELQDPILILQHSIHNENLAKLVFSLEQEILDAMGQENQIDEKFKIVNEEEKQLQTSTNPTSDRVS